MNISEDKRELIIKFALNNKDVTALKFINDDPGGITIQELSGGLVNYLYRVASKDERHSAVLKHAEEKAKAIDLEKISLDRQTTEYECLKLFNSIVPGCVPEPYCLDQEYNIIAMEDLSRWELLGQSLVNKGPNLESAAGWGCALAKINLATMKGKVSPERWQEVCKLRTGASRNLFRNYLFERYYAEAAKLTELPAVALDIHHRFVIEAVNAGLPQKMMELYDDKQCLIQVDCHWKSVFVKDKTVAMFDFDLATLSNPAVSVYIIASFVCCFVMSLNGGQFLDGRNTLNNDGRKKKLKFQEAVQSFLENYIKERSLVSEDLSKFISDTALFLGNQMFVFSVSENMQVFDPGFTVQNQASMLQPGCNVMKTHGDITTVDQLLTAAFDIQMFY